MKDNIETEGPEVVHERQKCLFLLDEFAALGVMTDIQSTLPVARSFGLQYCFMIQNMGQLTDLYGEAGGHAFFANTSLHMFFGCEDLKTVEHLSERLGKITVDDIGVEPPVSMPPPISDWDALTANTQPGQPFTLPTHGKHAAGAMVFNTFTTVMHQAALAGQGAARAEIEQTMRAHQAAQETLRAAYQHKMADHGKPRVAPDMIRKMIGKGPDDVVARGALVFSGGGDTALIQLEPYWVSHQRALAAAAEEMRQREEEIAAEHQRWQQAQANAAAEIERRAAKVDVIKEGQEHFKNLSIEEMSLTNFLPVVLAALLLFAFAGFILAMNTGNPAFFWCLPFAGVFLSSAWMVLRGLTLAGYVVQARLEKQIRDSESVDEGELVKAAWFRAKSKWSQQQRAQSESRDRESAA